VNSRDALPHGGRITVEAENVEWESNDAVGRLDAQPGSYVRIAVSDNGCGMSQEVQAKIFDPFFTTKEMGRGTGLGLSTVFGIVKQSGGNIWVYSEPGRGSTFKVYFPLAAGEAVADRRSHRPRDGRGHERLLLVEDEPALRRAMTRVLEES